MKLAIAETSAHRSGGIDLFRGLLVVLVILGHFSELTQRESFLTWVGLGFRMPLFIGLSGYLFNLEQARALPLAAFFGKYYRRLILPWLTACVVVLTLTDAIDWLAPWSIVAQPPFHLWFVPVLLSFVLITRGCGLSPAAMLAIALPGSIAAMYLLGAGHAVAPFALWMPDRRYFIYPVYFVLGLWVARRPFDPRGRWWSLALASVGLLWWCRLYDHPSLPGEVAAALVMCMPVIGLFPWLRQSALSLPLIVPVGRDSLFFYLWHPLAFALWISLGMSGGSLLALAFALILLAWLLAARIAPLAFVLGINPRGPRPRGTAAPNGDAATGGA
ncbi:acyltransferase [Sphingomonas sp. RB3P16]|uniref:acyltransferase n=1 Tax=Parasphingomonas frigoris TaxID=3096163 RepID=UPI002FCC76F5